MSANEAYRIAKEIYAELGVDTEAAMARVAEIPVSMHCWQGDDVRGFENPDGDLTGGIQTTGNYPGRAKTIEQLRADFEKAASLIPGCKNINLHAIYLDNCGEHVDRDEITPKHFESWVKWAKENGFGIDFNPTYFSHKNSADGFTLSHTDAGIRRFWIDHGKACRRIAEYIGKELGTTVMDNHWVPDGMKDIPVDRYAFRQRLMESYDEIFSEKIDRKYTIDSVEGKVFGIGVEAYTVGSAEFCLSYSMKNGITPLVDNGHYHPTEMVSDKISSLLLFSDKLALHVTRRMRWDSDHVVSYDDETREMMKECVRCGLDKVLIATDYFDASINRISAWVTGIHNVQKALLYALLEPTCLRDLQDNSDFTSLQACQELYKMMPIGDVWNEFLRREGKKANYLPEIKRYENEVLSKR